MTRDTTTTPKQYAKQMVGEKIVEVIADLQERYDCHIYLDKDDVDLLGTDEFYNQLMKNVVKHR